jgi:Holliday junction resolvasome RuvABC endonuclease subunit
VTIYIGLDQSLNNTGIAVTNGKKTTVTLQKSSAKLTELQKLYELELLLINLIQTLKPKRVYLENVYYVRFRIKSALSLLRVETTLKLVCLREKTEQTSLSANPREADSWPKLLGVTTTKEATAELFLPKLKDDTTTDHETDALGILYAGVIKDTTRTRAGMMRVPIIRVHAKDFRKDPRNLTNCFLQ